MRNQALIGGNRITSNGKLLSESETAEQVAHKSNMWLAQQLILLRIQTSNKSQNRISSPLPERIDV
jgi:hypothetical protein